MAIDYEAVLYWKERTLQLLLALDKARDTLDEDEDPQRMFQAVVEVLKKQFHADACAIVVVAETSDDLDYAANIGFGEDEYEPFCREALDRIGTGQINTPNWAHSLGIQVILKDFPLAGLVLARHSEPFSIEEMRLLNAGERQIDSAVIQARTIAKLTQRNRELEAIYRIDRLRDEMPNESTLIGGFAGIALERFYADLAIIVLGDANSGRHVLRSKVENGIPPDLLDAIHVRASDISIPQVIPSPDELSDVILLAAPFIVSQERLGAIVVGRRAPFTIGDHRLLYAMVSQMDTAVAKNRDINRRLHLSEGSADAQ